MAKKIDHVLYASLARLTRILPFLTLILFTHVSASLAQSVNCSLVSSAFPISEGIRGLKRKTSVPCAVKNKVEVEKEIRGILDTKISPARLKGEEILYKLLKVVPPDYEYKQKLIELYIHQLGGYYDPEKNKYVMADWIPASAQMVVAVHELTHALQDQYYDLDKFVDSMHLSSDTQLAYSGLVEGDATAVMTDYQRGLMRLRGIRNEESVDSIIMQTILSAGLSGKSNDIPPVIEHQLIFPYTSGLRFVHFFLKKDGYSAIDKIFKAPPKTTTEILHPEQYPLQLSSEEKQNLDEFGRGEKAIHSDSLGEFFISTWIGQLTKKETEGARLATGWRGDKAQIFSDPTDPQHFQLKWFIQFESESKAKTFVDFIKAEMKDFSITQKSPVQVLIESESTITLEG